MLFCDSDGWPAFSGGPAALERARGALLSLSFNALDHSPDDLTVLIGELFHQVRPPPRHPPSPPLIAATA